MTLFSATLKAGSAQTGHKDLSCKYIRVFCSSYRLRTQKMKTPSQQGGGAQICSPVPGTLGYTNGKYKERPLKRSF